ncbi:MAG: hypothetical protein IIB66_13290, partial [Proteobacteria bacterium]|nr:hypothetical protein [Pseudomonadota bacterium]
MVMRFEDWPRRLAAFVEEAGGAGFDWASFNCFHFPADAVLVMTGVDPMKPLRGAKYKTERGAIGALRRFLGPRYKGLSVDELIESAARKLYTGFPAIGALYAQRGDVCLVNAPITEGMEGTALGVCLGSRVGVLGRTGGSV